MRKILSLALILIVALVSLTGCSDKEKGNENTMNTKNENNTNTAKSEETNIEKFDFKSAAEKQMELPEVGEQIAIMHIKDYGDVFFKFFPEVAPKAVENFVKHSQEGYYNGLTFHRVINEFMIQGGDPDGNGTGGESIWGKGFGTELDYSLVPYRGSLCMAMSSMPNSIGSQFFITQANYSEKMANTLKLYGYPQGLLEQYKNHGGYLSLYMQYTVFGQAFQGMDIVDEIAKVKTNSADKPEKDVIIESIEITDYTE